MWVPAKPWLVLKDVVTLNYIRLVWFEIKRLPKKGALLGGVTVSIAAWVERYVSSGEPRNATHCKHRGLQPCSRDRFPQSKCNNFALAEEDLPSEIVTALLRFPGV